MLPQYWTEFVQSNALWSSEFSISPADDLSGVGVEMSLLTEAQSEQEATLYWPGIGVLRDGYVPIGSCSIGTGDPYFINLKDGKGGPLYRIYHDSVGEAGYDEAQAIAKVLANYEHILRFVCS